jgi:hypothetical protein
MVTSSVFPLLAAAWRGVFPVSAAIFTLIGGLTWKQNGDTKNVVRSFIIN